MYRLTMDVWSSVTSILESFVSPLTSIATPLAIVVLIIAGILYMTTKEKSEMAKHLIERVIIGSVIVLAASSFVSWLSSMLIF